MTEKIIVSLSLVFCVVFALLLTVSNLYSLACVSRFFYGFFQSLIHNYFPAWIEAFGVNRQKQSWIVIYMLSPMVSFLLGYIITGLTISYDKEWENLFYA